jgi:cyclopropane fatty-acyl-phospholipid synthase-like methyltransferase
MKESNMGVSRYTSHEYLHHNPTWDSEDSPWKARKVLELLTSANCSPSSVCEVGCGAGGVLVELRKAFPAAELFGYDIAPDAARFWADHAWAKIFFKVGDLLEMNQRRFDVLLVIDVIEHVENPFDFLRRLRAYGGLFVFHFPLDLSVSNILRESPLLRARSRVGHLQFFTKHLALSLLKECHYHVLDCRYTEAAFTGPKRNWKSRIAALPRRLAYSVNRDFGVRLLGGETLMVLARVKDDSDY